MHPKLQSKVRSVFGTVEQLNLLKRNTVKYVANESTSWRAGGVPFFIISILFLSSVFVISYIVLNDIISGSISVPLGIGLISSFVFSSNSIKNIGSLVRRLTASHSRIKDLFEFMRTYGKQTYPVLEDSFDQKNS
jgi:ABC-type multidrug transport system fused ATPase/permease subunit